MRIHFLGANGNVTGSQHFVEEDQFRFLVDCGMVQERDFLNRNWDVNPEQPQTINAVLLTHAHLDHCGLLPKLGKDGFHGKIYGTPATIDLAKLILYDSAHIQEEDALFKKKRHQKEQRKSPHPIVPLYTQSDVDQILPMFEAIEYNKPIEIGPGVRATFYDAGHVLGSSFIEVEFLKTNKRLLFSGDLGRPNRPILRDPAFFTDPNKEIDALLVESTYGDRNSENISGVDDQLAAVINKTVARGGKIIMPVFAVERAQEVLIRLHSLIEKNKIGDNYPIYLDSPMAVEATQIFKKHPECFDKETMERYRREEKMGNLQFLKTCDESRTLNSLKGPAIIMSSAGMCNAGRIKHHLVNHIGDPKNTILFLGYQSYGTLGYQIVKGAKEVRIHGQMRKVKASIESIRGISGHADRQELLHWVQEIPHAPKKIFVVHGETSSSQSFAKALRQNLPSSEVIIPKYNESFEL